MTYKLFIDDERNPVTDDWVICRTSAEAKLYVLYNGPPIEISLDHDLGGDDTTIKFLKWWIDKITTTPVQHDLKVSENFWYSIHSQNPVGAKNMEYMVWDIIRISRGDI